MIEKEETHLSGDSLTNSNSNSLRKNMLSVICHLINEYGNMTPTIGDIIEEAMNQSTTEPDEMIRAIDSLVEDKYLIMNEVGEYSLNVERE